MDRTNKKASKAEIAIDSIKLIDFYINDDADLSEKKDLVYSVEVKYNINIKSDTISVIIGFTLLNQNDINLKLMYILSESVFRCKNLSNYFDANQKKFKNQKIEDYITEVSYSHLRGMHALKVNDTNYKSFLIPLNLPELPRKKS